MCSGFLSLSINHSCFLTIQLNLFWMKSLTAQYTCVEQPTKLVLNNPPNLCRTAHQTCVEQPTKLVMINQTFWTNCKITSCLVTIKLDTQCFKVCKQINLSSAVTLRVTWLTKYQYKLFLYLKNYFVIFSCRTCDLL